MLNYQRVTMLHIPPDINGDLTGPGLTLSAARIFLRNVQGEMKRNVPFHAMGIRQISCLNDFRPFAALEALTLELILYMRYPSIWLYNFLGIRPPVVIQSVSGTSQEARRNLGCILRGFCRSGILLVEIRRLSPPAPQDVPRDREGNV